MSRLDPYGLQNAVQQWTGINQRIEPTFPPDPVRPPQQAAQTDAPPPEEEPPPPMDDAAATAAWTQRMKAAREAKQAPANRARASREGQKAVGAELDRAATENWQAKMQAAKAIDPTWRAILQHFIMQNMGGPAMSEPGATPMVPPTTAAPWKTPYTTQGVAAENAIGRELFGGGRHTWPPEPPPEE